MGAGTRRPPRLPSSDEHESDRLSRWPAKIWIEPEIELARNYELSDQDLSRVLQLVIEHEQEIRDAWHRHFDS